MDQLHYWRPKFNQDISQRSSWFLLLQPSRGASYGSVFRSGGRCKAIHLLARHARSWCRRGRSINAATKGKRRWAIYRRRWVAKCKRFIGRIDPAALRRCDATKSKRRIGISIGCVAAVSRVASAKRKATRLSLLLVLYSGHCAGEQVSALICSIAGSGTAPKRKQFLIVGSRRRWCCCRCRCRCRCHLQQRLPPLLRRRLRSHRSGRCRSHQTGAAMAIGEYYH